VAGNKVLPIRSVIQTAMVGIRKHTYGLISTYHTPFWFLAVVTNPYILFIYQAVDGERIGSVHAIPKTRRGFSTRYLPTHHLVAHNLVVKAAVQTHNIWWGCTLVYSVRSTTDRRAGGTLAARSVLRAFQVNGFFHLTNH